MDFLTLAKTRCACRAYTDQKVEPEKRDKILEAARVAPTGKNLQAFRLLVIESEEGRKKLATAANTYQAPLAVVTVADVKHCWERPFDGKIISDIDASIVSTHMVLEAADLGLASLWICRFDPQMMREAFAIPEGFEPVNVTVFGYPADAPKSPDRHETERKPLEALVVRESF